ncbi:aspartyl-phosphate phosphatase Spo0E family protein [Desulfitobacterium sp.]|uniref:aspartyl-phosphate phosphatase Spo0E family protein n=1 Tax=Desulfitobacterium sp. TaxID=49981 RepID=UPI002B206D0F|nr:aspartyl-phosphate phosphatase Spo0E family protein [Desulfitobacterium sp.]MEA4902795.1 aspartyl-phosphate phosphatase Spo0E family protein [Desulfitobacterium sp.]
MNFKLEYLQELIEIMREELIQLGMSRPFTDPEVIRVSQDLDQLLNEYEYLKHNYRYILEHVGA